MTVTIFPYLIKKKPSRNCYSNFPEICQRSSPAFTYYYRILFRWSFLPPQSLEFKGSFCVLSFISVTESFTHSIMFSYF